MVYWMLFCQSLALVRLCCFGYCTANLQLCIAYGLLDVVSSLCSHNRANCWCIITTLTALAFTFKRDKIIAPDMDELPRPARLDIGVKHEDTLSSCYIYYVYNRVSSLTRLGHTEPHLNSYNITCIRARS